MRGRECIFIYHLDSTSNSDSCKSYLRAWTVSFWWLVKSSLLTCKQTQTRMYQSVRLSVTSSLDRLTMPGAEVLSRVPIFRVKLSSNLSFR